MADKSKTITAIVRLKPPALDEVTPIKVLAGEQTPVWNLRDHPELDGCDLIVTKVKPIKGGQFGDYMMAGVWIVKPGAKTADLKQEEDFRYLMTGADNVLERVMIAYMNDALPIRGTLHLKNRFWLFD